jgi:hypothetical protein
MFKGVTWKGVAAGVAATAVFLKFVAPRVPALAGIARAIS